MNESKIDKKIEFRDLFLWKADFLEIIPLYLLPSVGVLLIKFVSPSLKEVVVAVEIETEKKGVKSAIGGSAPLKAYK